MHPLEASMTAVTAQGHTRLTKADANRAWAKGYTYTKESLDVALAAGDLVRIDTDLTTALAVLPEARIAAWLARRGTAKPAPTLGMAGATPATCNAGQRAAWHTLAGESTATLTGLPGTGKTWLVAAYIRAMIEAGRSVKVVAPTGQAAAVLSLKLVGVTEVVTIHRALGLRPGELYNDKKLEYELVVVDETSMVDAELMAFLCASIDTDTQVIFVGDPNQLPPVGAGWPFRDLVSIVPNAHLTQPQRTSLTSGILTMSYAAVDGRLELPTIQHNGILDVDYIESLDSNALNIIVGRYCSGELAQRYGLEDVTKQALILSPVKDSKYETSTGYLNQAISHKLYPKRIFGRSKFTSGDRILFTVNDREHGFVNGERGLLIDYNDGNAVIESDYGKRYELEGWSLADYAEWGYAMTVHKAQGAEADLIVLLLSKEAGFIYNRNLLYTAMTRAKKNLLLVGDLSILDAGLKNPTQRNTCLGWLCSNDEAVRRIISHASPTDFSKFGSYL